MKNETAHHRPALSAPGRKARHLVVDAAAFGSETLTGLLAEAKRVKRTWPGPVTVVADAKWRYRSADRDERSSFDSALLDGTVLCPPAGTNGGVGRFLEAVGAAADALVWSPKHLVGIDQVTTAPAV